MTEVSSNVDMRILHIPAGKSVTVFSQHKDSAGYGYTRFCVSGNIRKIHSINLICGNRLFDTIRPSLFSTVLSFPIMDTCILPATVFDEYSIQCASDEAFTVIFTCVQILTPLCRYVCEYRCHQYDIFQFDPNTTCMPLTCNNISTKLLINASAPIFNITLQLDSVYVPLISSDDMHHAVTFKESINFSKIDIARLHFEADKKGVLHIVTETEGCAIIQYGMIHRQG
jgi:hypothetical protein